VKNLILDWKTVETYFIIIFIQEFERKRGKKKKTTKVRDEIQEYPNKPSEEAFMDKLKNDYNSDKTFSIGI
jgi:hypothetical protein